MGRLFVAIFLTSAATCIWPPSAGATDPRLWMELGNVIGSEAICGLSYDQDAIKAFIEKNVSPNDMEFVGDLDMRVNNAKREDEAMSVSQKTAHCVQIGRIAKAFGFVK